MEGTPQLFTAADLEMHAARVADPSTDLKTKLAVATELREMIDIVREAESARVVPHMIPVLLDILKSGTPAFHKDSLEYQFRRCLLDTLHRMPLNDSIRPQIPGLFHGALHLLRHDNEDNGITCCKCIIDIVRLYRLAPEDLVSEFMTILQEILQSMAGLMEETLRADSPLVDANISFPARRSPKVLAEMGMAIVAFTQINRPVVMQSLQPVLPMNISFLSLESPVQKRTREDHKATKSLFIGMAPEIKNSILYTDIVIAQIKVVSYLAFIFRGLGEQYESEGDSLMLTVIRLLQDCPVTAVTARRDLMLVFKHLLGTPHRRALLPYLDRVLDERMLTGTAVGCQELIRQNAFGCTSDLILHMRGEMTAAQLTRLCHIHLRHLHDPSLPNPLQIYSIKIVFNVIEVIIAKDTQQGAGRTLKLMLDALVAKLECLSSIQANFANRIERAKKGETETADISLIEKSRPVAAAAYASEKTEELLVEYRHEIRLLLLALRTILSGLKKCDAPVPEGTIISRLFEGAISCMSFFDGQPHDANEPIEALGNTLIEVNLHVFQEVWTQKIGFFFECAEKRPFLTHLAQTLFGKEGSSATIVAIVLRFLVNRLPELGDYDDQPAAVTIRMFKMAFNAVVLYPHHNEHILAGHLGKLIMDCFPLAAKAAKPMNYFLLLKLLFRAIGGGGGRFELLYKAVLPLLPEMLDCLNRQLLISEGPARDMIVELCLTVPLRLTHLLPYLSYLMQPLVLALRGGPDLVSQGLRTLELCIDNLTPDFLDPTLNIVLRDLMEALHNHLRPLPANHHHSHTTIRILGKLGGRNRRLLDKEPALNFELYSDLAKLRINLGGTIQGLELTPMSTLAFKTLTAAHTNAAYRAHAYEYLETTLNLMLREGVRGRDREDLFIQCLEGLLDAFFIPDLQERAEMAVHDTSRAILAAEVRRMNKDAISRRFPSQIFICFLQALPHGLARKNNAEAKRAQELMTMLIKELVSMATGQEYLPQDVIHILNQVAGRFSALCLEDLWVHKSAGCAGIGIMTQMPGLAVRWVNERELDLVRTLLIVLKGMLYDLPRDVQDVTDVLLRVIRVCNADLSSLSDEALMSNNKVGHLISIFMNEISSPNAIVRTATKTCIEQLAELAGRTPAQLLIPHRDRVLATLYTKPLRALPFTAQVGTIEAVRYCINLQPPPPELNDELLRLLHETLALADAEDMGLVSRNNVRQSTLEIVKLRVACIKLLTASMPLTDFFSKQHQTRQRVTGVYFKSLYSPVPEIKEVAHDGLRMVLTHQSRLPKELLQTGLRPILMNLADPKRLSIPGLEGLARLLELLTNYFKVEIGHKLLDHFRVVADPQMLQASSKLPLADNEGITKLVRLANIFHLLPLTANIFLENLVNAIVQTEAQMHFSGQSPFSEPLAKYLDRYYVEAVDFFMKHLHFPRHVRTLRSILQAKLVSNLLRELASRTSLVLSTCFEGGDVSLILPGLLLCNDLADLVPGWLQENPRVLETVLPLWYTDPTSVEQSGISLGDVTQRYFLILSLFQKALQQSPRIDLVFPLVAVFSWELPLDLAGIAKFLYNHISFNDNLAFRRNVLTRFIIWFQDPSVSWTHKAHFIQYVFTPTVLVHSVRSPDKAGLLDDSIISKMHAIIWQPLNDDATYADAGDSLRIELLNLTTVMVHRYPEFLQDVKKDIIRCAWHYITSEDTIVKQTAYLLAARFFESFEGPQKFHLRVWTGLLKPPHGEGKMLVRQALDIMAPVLLRSQTSEGGYPQWAKTTRRLLSEEGTGWQQIAIIYHLITRQQSLFYPVRALFIPHIVNFVPRLGMGPTASAESRILSVDILQVVFDWEQKATAQAENPDTTSEGSISGTSWVTPLPFRESMVSYLVRLATTSQDIPSRGFVTPRAIALLRLMVGPTGWSDVTFKLHYFSRALEQNDIKADATLLGQAQSSAKVLQVISADKPDPWYHANALILTKLVRKGMVSEDHSLQDSLHPVFDRLIRLYPLPKEEEDQQSEVSDFHNFIYTSIGEHLRNAEELRTGAVAVLRGVLLMLKSVVQVAPERIEPFNNQLMKLLGRLTKDHLQSSPPAPNFEINVRLITFVLEISQATVAYLGDQRKVLISALIALVEKSKSAPLCRYMLDIARDWAMNKKDPYPTMKDKATLLQKMAIFELRGDRGEPLFNNYLELIYDIYTDPSLRRTDLTTRLELPFMLGCRATDPVIRERFIGLLDVSIPRSVCNRLTYILGVQNWDPLADHNWIFLASYLLLGSVDTDTDLSLERKAGQDTFSVTSSLQLGQTSVLIRPMQRLLFLDPQVAHETWISIFSVAWGCLSRREQVDITHHLITLLSRDYHLRQAEMRPNVIQTLLAGVRTCVPPIMLPPHLVKYLGKTYGAWHVAAELLESSLYQVREDEAVVRDTVYDSLAEVYAELAEDDMFYGLWRRRALFTETNMGIAYEQCGMWEQASAMYEGAQLKVRNGTLPFSEAEFCLWEDHWILAAEKLQNWEILYEFARAEGNHELLLESAWRTRDWTETRETLEEQIASLQQEFPTPRRRVFEAFIALLKMPAALDKNTDFTRILEDAMQLSLRKWITLPPHLSAAHIPLLQHFQQFVELQEAVQIFGSLSATNAQNLEKKSSDLKMVLQAWRERLPNVCDDISIWSDLVAWRQNVFNAINKAYIPLINAQAQGTGTNGGSSPTFGYRGYHETAWIINRFAHVARKHDLLEVCFSQLNKIYTLPNIEISEAFLKLREQARCHFQKPGDLQAGLEVINNTNLIYFSLPQKAEFHTLKGMFHAKFGRNEEANAAFGQAVQLDMIQAKAWAAWGKFNDRVFKEQPNDMSYAANAVSCYLQAAGLYKSRKSRPLLTRVLWLLSIDDGSFTVSRAFDTYKGDAAYWYWITLIPQLCLSISQREVKQARYILLNLAKFYPQALFYHLRTTREEMTHAKRRAMEVAAAQRALSQADGSKDQPMQDATVNGSMDKDEASRTTTDGTPAMSNAAAHENRPADALGSHPARQSWEYVDEVVQILKTAFPLLILTMESVIEQLTQRFKPTAEEEVYRYICMLLSEAVSQYVNRMGQADDDGMLSPQQLASVNRMANGLGGSTRKEFEEDFLKNKLTLYEYIRRLQHWRDKHEKVIDARPRLQSLEVLSHNLVEFQYTRFDDIEVPGQYTEDKDNNQNFVKMLKFGLRFENCRTHMICYRRFNVHGHDHSMTTFAVQCPASKHCRREERVMQMFRTFNSTLYRKKESRKRNLHFYLPVAVPCSTNMRLLQNDSSHVILGDIYDQHCEDTGITREEPTLVSGEKLKAALREFRQSNGRNLQKTEFLTLKKDILDEVVLKLAPEDLLTRYMIRTMDGPCELWKIRKQFALQLASVSFMTYVLCLTNRVPSRYHLSRRTGELVMSELLPGLSPQGPVFITNDSVPFRFTPNFQHFLGPVMTEGVFAAGIMALGRCLTEPEFDLEQQLCLFSRDEVMTWQQLRGKPWSSFDMSFRASVVANIEGVVKRAEVLACKLEREQAILNPQNPGTAPVLQTVTNLISTATNPLNLAKMGDGFLPWF